MFCGISSRHRACIMGMRLIGCSLGFLGRLLVCLLEEGSDFLGSRFVASWSFFWASWERLGSSWGLLGASWGVLEPGRSFADL